MIRDDLHMPLNEPGITCGCTDRSAVCVEGKRLEAQVAATYRAGIGIYGRRAASQARNNWDKARDAYDKHLRDTHRD